METEAGWKVQLIHSPPTLTCLACTFCRQALRKQRRPHSSSGAKGAGTSSRAAETDVSPRFFFLLLPRPSERLRTLSSPLFTNKRLAEINHYFVLISLRLVYGGAISFLIKTNCLSLTSTEFFLQLSDKNKHVLVAPSPRPRLPRWRPRTLALVWESSTCEKTFQSPDETESG